MAVDFYTQDAEALITKFIKLISQDEPKGRINTWEVHKKGFRHTSENWREKGLLTATIDDDNKKLSFRQTELTEEYAYSYYQAHILQVFIEHLSGLFTSAQYFDGRAKRS